MPKIKKLIKRKAAPANKKVRVIARKPKAVDEPKRVEALPNVKMLPDGDHLASVLVAFDRKAEPVRIGGRWIHVSYLVNGDCLRAMQIGHRLDVKALSKPTSADRLVWTIGKAVEKHIRDTAIRAVGRHRAFGAWSCRCKSLQYNGLGTEQKCRQCGEIASEYGEYNTRDESLLLSGSVDLILMVGGTPDDPILMVVEIKSIKVVPKNGVRTSAPDFHNLEAPSRTHALQALCYHALLTREGYRVSDEVVVMYAAKDYVTVTPYKPFTLNATDPANAYAVEALFNIAHEYSEFDDTRDLLPRLTACSDSTCSKVKGCPVGAQCFAVRNNRLSLTRSNNQHDTHEPD